MPSHEWRSFVIVAPLVTSFTFAHAQATYADVLRAMRACRNNVPEAVARLLPPGQAQRGQDII
jgi:hypothetical protein